MTNEELKNCLARAVHDGDLSDEDLPDIDLYVDQILSLVSRANEGAEPRYRERELTKTMINNYSKDGLISPIEGKKYSKEHIVEMLLVYTLKSTLSIGEIKRVLSGVRQECGMDGKDLTACYHRLLTLKERNRRRVSETVEKLFAEDGLNVSDDRDFLVALCDIISLSAYLKTVAQEMLEARYADPDVAEREAREKEKEKEKTEKREREERERQEKEARKKAKNERAPEEDAAEKPAGND